MDLKKSQHYNFCYEALPILFHSQTSDFHKYLERDGLAFLEFWWNHVGERLATELLVPFAGMAYGTFPLNEKTTITFITLPKPREVEEMYFLGLIANPEKRFGWVRLPSTRVIGLVMRPKDKFDSGTEMGDMTPRGIFVSLGEGPEATKEAFQTVVIEKAKPKPR
jgi:hypothetical protein